MTNLHSSKNVLGDLREILTWARDNEHSSLYSDVLKSNTLKSLGDLSMFPTTNTGTLRKSAENLRHYPEDLVRYLSSEFDPKKLDELFLVPQRTDETWNTVEYELSKLRLRAAFLSIPPFWQVSPFFYHTCRKHHVPVSVGNPRSPNLSLQIIEGVEVEYAAVTPAVMHELREGVMEKGIRDSVQFWHVISPLGPVPHVPKTGKGVRVSVEYHLFPGIPVAYTSPEQYAQDKQWAMPLPEYLYEFGGGTCYITSLRKHAMPFVRFEIPAKVEQCEEKYPLFRFV